MDVSGEISEHNSTNESRKNVIISRRTSSRKSLRNSILFSSKKDLAILAKEKEKEKEKEEEEKEEKEEETPEERKERLKKERTDFLIKLLTEDSPRTKARKNKLKLRPLNTFGNMSSSNNNYTLTEPKSVNNSLSKPVDPKEKEKEKRKLEEKMRKERERRKKEKERKENQEIMDEINAKRLKHKEIFRNNLNRLYGYNKKFLFFHTKLRREKYNNLEKYQDDILRVSSINLSKDNMLKLFSDLKTIRIHSEQAKPLPPINFRALVYHSLDESNNKKKKSGFRIKNKKFSQMDEYEKELFLIKTNTRHEKFNISNNKFLYKMYEILPEHVVETIYAKKRKF